MHLERIETENFACYAGKQTVHLEPGAYGITAYDPGSKGRSNWLGKSTFLEMVPFALFGRLRKEHRSARSIITHGEDRASVSLFFSDGTRVTRRIKEKMTLEVEPMGGEVLRSALAQEEIEKWLCLSPDDFYASCYVEQRAIAKLVLTTPAERYALVSGWLGLERFEHWHEQVKAKVTATENDLDLEQGRRDGLLRDLAVLCANAGVTFIHPLSKLHERLQQEESKAGEQRGREEAEHAAWLERVKLAAEVARLKGVGDEFERLQARKTELMQQLGTFGATLSDEDISARRVEIEAEIRRLRSEVETRRLRVIHGFDGECPVTKAGCPARETIQSESAALAHAKSESEKRCDAYVASVQPTLAQLRAEAEKNRLRADGERELSRLVNQLAGMTGDMEKFAAVYLKSGPQVDIILLMRTLANEPDPTGPEPNRTAVHRLQTLRDLSTRVDSAIKRLSELDARIKQFTTYLHVYRQAAFVLSRYGAQKVYADSVLSQIESQANTILEEAGIPLSLFISWDRETTQLAPDCFQCWHHYGTTQRIKQCPVCAAARQPKMANEFKINLSDRSGAAEDLGGLAFQLAACRHVSKSKGSPFGVALLDEPFGQLDEANRLSLSRHLPGILARIGFEQSFTVAHHSSIMNALPNRLIIESKGGVARMRTE